VKALVVYSTQFGNTQMVAEAITSELGDGRGVRLINSEDLLSQDLSNVDLVVMGTPTHNMNLPKSLQPILDRIPRRSLKSVAVAAFDTSYKMSPFLSRFTAAKKLNRKLRKLGGIALLPPETFHVEEREGPLFPGEIERARAWALRIVRKINGNKAT
jgi:flavodoxin